MCSVTLRVSIPAPFIHDEKPRRGTAAESPAVHQCVISDLDGLVFHGPLVPPGSICWAGMHDQAAVLLTSPANVISAFFFPSVCFEFHIYKNNCKRVRRA